MSYVSLLHKKISEHGFINPPAEYDKPSSFLKFRKDATQSIYLCVIFFKFFFKRQKKPLKVKGTAVAEYKYICRTIPKVLRSLHLGAPSRQANFLSPRAPAIGGRGPGRARTGDEGALSRVTRR